MQEDEEGGIQHSVDSFMARARRKRSVSRSGLVAYIEDMRSDGSPVR